MSLAAAGATAETAYVIDKLLVGVHAEQALDSKIVKVLPTGTRLEVLKRDGDLAQVKDETGVVGWLDAGYLMSETPAALRVEAAQAQIKELSAALAAAEKRANQRVPANPAKGADTASMATEKADLEQRLASERLKVGELQARIAELLASAQGATDTAEVQQRNAELEARLNALEAEGLGGIARRVVESKPALLILAIVLALMLGGGAFGFDAWQRRRRGGFRI